MWLYIIYVYLTLSLLFAGQVTGMSRLADTMFVGFAIRPDWNHRESLSPARIDIEPVFSRHLQHNPRYQHALQLLESVVREEFAFPHVYDFPSRLNTVTDNGGYFVDTVSHQLTVNPLQLAPGVAAPSLHKHHHIPLNDLEIENQLTAHRGDVGQRRASANQPSHSHGKSSQLT